MEPEIQSLAPRASAPGGSGGSHSTRARIQCRTIDAPSA